MLSRVALTRRHSVTVGMVVGTLLDWEHPAGFSPGSAWVAPAVCKPPLLQALSHVMSDHAPVLQQSLCTAMFYVFAALASYTLLHHYFRCSYAAVPLQLKHTQLHSASCVLVKGVICLRVTIVHARALLALRGGLPYLGYRPSTVRGRRVAALWRCWVHQAGPAGQQTLSKPGESMRQAHQQHACLYMRSHVGSGQPLPTLPPVPPEARLQSPTLPEPMLKAPARQM